jgi:uncharacterized delta-60 repeat protein
MMKNSPIFLIRCAVLLLLSALCLSIPVDAQVVEEWVARYSGPGDFHDAGFAVAVDSDGYVYVTGRLWSPISDDWITIKYDPDGIEQWSSIYDGPDHGIDLPWGILVDNGGSVYVTGESYAYGAWKDIVTIKYTPDGIEQWVARYDGPAGNLDIPLDMVIDADGNVYVIGESAGNGTSLDMVTIKYDTNGNEQWIVRWTSPGEQMDGGFRIETDVNGDVIVLVGARNPANRDFVTIKYAPDGVELWSATHNGLADAEDTPWGLALDGDGNIYVTGSGTQYIPYSDFVTIKYTPDGIEQWVAYYDGPMYNHDRARDIAVSANGNVFVTGYSAGFMSGWDYATIKYNSDGEEQWVARYDGPAHITDFAYNIAIDQDENVYVSGESTAALSNDDYCTIKYSTSGDEEWIARYNGPANAEDKAWAMTSDVDGNVYVTGESSGIWTFKDFATIKYSQMDADVEAALTPYGAPIQIPAAGGTFEYNLEIENLAADTVGIEVWCDVEVPFGNIPVIALGPVSVELPGGFVGSVDRTAEVPGRAPFGTYTVNAYVGSYPNIIWDRDSFTFEKLMTGDGVDVGDWAFGGGAFEELTGKGKENLAPTEFDVVSAYPNPFNAITVISYQLSAVSFVNLAVYDVSGRRIAELVNGWRDAGMHDVTFDGSDLASGIYIYRLRMEGSEVGGKVVLLK